MSDNEQNGGNAEEKKHINITVKSQEGEELQFKVKPETKFKKIFAAYAQNKGIDASAVRFLFDGDSVNPDSTPKMLEMEDGDQIDCLLEQIGGW
mmetsp:Transcript_53425/g.130003  ORF Transcript_53425/g.130003 Transcript_53425/m.130003 type:complete len:94 (+) Transcript_53425:1297-1578(+)|eukprot:CAMPEP_0113452580 /NCGR_PEP_ID=MMETSP0014_2-20120614/6920_1 /TAXON_ID=2857 /ORGANISM="Nitzschia sp." /LENGTH=93 /DNA_ID=CAMNT_0000343957 /DNA_START=117 /DNA_END=398 /DNA_ORIENTATION=- /assembly_acc=CAM_ASM_000159